MSNGNGVKIVPTSVWSAGVGCHGSFCMKSGTVEELPKELEKTPKSTIFVP